MSEESSHVTGFDTMVDSGMKVIAGNRATIGATEGRPRIASV